MARVAEASSTPGTVDQPRLGRPATGAAKTSTERNRERRERLALQGGSVVTVHLDAPASKALAALRKGGATIDQAVADALRAAAATLRR